MQVKLLKDKTQEALDSILSVIPHRILMHCLF